MKHALKIFCGIIIVLFLSGCNVYQMVSLSSDLPLNGKFQFLMENDSVNIVYSFNGQSGPIHIELYNKLDKPLYIDWAKCALVIKEQSYSLWNDEATINGNALEFKVEPNNTIKSIASFDGTISRQEKVTFIPPHTKISRDSYTVCSTIIDNSGKPYENIKLYTEKEEYSEYKAKKVTFSKEDSPLTFSIFLSVSDNENFNHPMQFNSNFWGSSFFNTKFKRATLYMGNQFYNMN